jgi:hypothetical protein
MLAILQIDLLTKKLFIKRKLAIYLASLIMIYSKFNVPFEEQIVLLGELIVSF